MEENLSQPDKELIALWNTALYGVCDWIAAYPGEEYSEFDALSALIHVFCERALQHVLIAGEMLEDLYGGRNCTPAARQNPCGNTPKCTRR
jgi:hypothetical protein